MEQKVCLITGGNAGIGKAAAIQLAQYGFKVIIGCRNELRGIASQNEIRELSKNPNVEFLLINMASQSSIKTAVSALKLSCKNIDVLIHNAADFDISRKQQVFTEENIETVWATNHVGPVLLTHLLLDQLKCSEQGRVITIASQGLMLHPFLKVDLADPEFKNKKYSVEKAYYQSKLAQVMYTYWLANDLKDTTVTANCIRVTNVKIDIGRYPKISNSMKFMYSIKSRFSMSPEKMARTYVYLSASKDLETISGKYFNEKSMIVSSSRYSKNWENIEELMQVTMKYIRGA